MAKNPDEYPTEEAPRQVTDAERPDEELASSNEGTYRQIKKGQRNTALMLLGGFGALLLAGYFLLYKPYSTQQVATRPVVQPPNTFTTQPTGPTAPPSYSRLDITPKTGNLPRAIVGSGRQTVTFTLTATDGTVTVNRVNLPFAQTSGLKLETDCANRTLTDGEQCAAQVTYEPTAPASLNAEILINAQRYDKTTGKTAPLNQNITITGIAEAQPATPAPPPAPVAAAAPPTDPRAQRIAAARKAFLEQQSASFAGAGPTAAAENSRPIDSNWRDIGFTQAVGSFPVDMTRVVTMDKPLPAVLEIPIDTRNPSRAVAKIERDIYGNDGMVPVIERGSTVIGRVQSVTDVAEEKVNISWQRVIRPDGVAFSFEGTSGDAMGRSGALAYIDNRWIERFGTSIAASAINALTALALNGNQTTTSAGGSYSSSSGSYLGGTSQQQLDGRALATQALEANVQPLISKYIQQQQRISPIRTIPKGTRIVIFSNQDFWLKPIPAPSGMTADGVSDVTGVGGQARTGAVATASTMQQNLPTNAPAQPAKPVDTSLTGPTAVDNMRQRQQQDNQQDQTYRGLPQGAIYNPNVQYQSGTVQPYVPPAYGAPQYAPPNGANAAPTGAPNEQQLPPWAR